MLGEKEKNVLYELRLLDLFKQKEIELIDFIIKHERIPNYSNERSEYQVLLRLRNKLKHSREMVRVLTKFFEIAEPNLVSNKSIRGDLD